MTGKSKLLSRVLICAPLAMLGALFLHAQTDLNGYWVFKVPRGDGTFTESYFELKQSGDTVTGNTVGGRGQTAITEGSFRDGKLQFAVALTGRGGQRGGTPQTLTTTYEGTLQGDKFALTMTGGRRGPPSSRQTFPARIARRPRQQTRAHASHGVEQLEQVRRQG